MTTAIIAAVAPRAAAAPPPPVTMPDLDPRDEIGGSVTLSDSKLFEPIALGLDVSGRVQLGPVEAFASAPLLVLHDAGISGFEGRRYYKRAVGIGNLRLGGRGRIARGPITLGVAGWAWVPMLAGTGGDEDPAGGAPPGRWPWRSSESIDAVIGIRDPYAWRHGLAVGAAIDVRWSDQDGFGQIELGTAVAFDRDPFGVRHAAVDDLFAAIGVGWNLRRYSVAVEYRLVMEPALVAPRREVQHAVMTAIACKWATDTVSRLRFGLATVDYHLEPGRLVAVIIGYDLLWRL